jgi:hypothetical protein
VASVDDLIPRREVKGDEFCFREFTGVQELQELRNKIGIVPRTLISETAVFFKGVHKGIGASSKPKVLLVGARCEYSMEDKTHWKIKRSIGGRNKFPVCLHPTGSSTGEHRWTGGFHPDNITVYHRDPHSNLPSDVHL